MRYAQRSVLRSLFQGRARSKNVSKRPKAELRSVRGYKSDQLSLRLRSGGRLLDGLAVVATQGQ